MRPRRWQPTRLPRPGILQARTLEWVAISFSNAWKWKVKVKPLSHVQLLTTPWTAACQAPLSMGFSRQEYWSGLPCPPPGDLPNPGIEPRSPVLQTDCLPSEPPGKPMNTGVDSLFHFLGTVSTQESNWGLLQYRWIFYQLSYRGSPRSWDMTINTIWDPELDLGIKKKTLVGKLGKFE